MKHMDLIVKFVWSILFLTLSLVLSGCTPRWHAVFVNGTKQNLVVELFDPQEQLLKRQATVLPGQSTKMEVQIGILHIIDSSGSMIARHELLLVDPNHKYSDRGEKRIYILLTMKGVHLIPKQYRESWRAHVDEISGD